jgi:hypothetical protein
MQCSVCSKSIERANYVNGVVMCAACTMQQAEDEQLPRRSNVEAEWSRFTSQKRRRHQWR